MEHTIKVKQGDIVDIIVEGKDGSLFGQRIATAGLQKYQSPARTYTYKSSATSVARAISMYCRAIRTGKWSNHCFISRREAEKELCNVLSRQNEVTLMGLTDKTINNLTSTLSYAENSATLKAISAALLYARSL